MRRVDVRRARAVSTALFAGAGLLAGIGLGLAERDHPWVGGALIVIALVIAAAGGEVDA